MISYKHNLSMAAEKALFDAVKEGDLGKIKAALTKKPKLTALDEFESTALHVAVMTGQLDATKTLVAAGAPLEERNATQDTVLFRRVFYSSYCCMLNLSEQIVKK